LNKFFFFDNIWQTNVLDANDELMYNVMGGSMTIKEKLIILADSAKYDASCSSSGSQRKNKNGLGNASLSGICHSFSADGRCVSLLKILMTNCCIYDCKYCINRKSNNIKRAIFTPEEICEITINFYKRNYIEGLFLSSGIIKNPNYTMEKMLETITLLRKKYNFHGYIHAKIIPSASKELIKKIGLLADRVSANIELPSNTSLKLLAPDKNKDKITETMTYVKENQSKSFVPAGQSTQMIVGAGKETDLAILNTSENLYNNQKLKRVFYSAYIPVNKDKMLPSIKIPPLIRENRLYQADWLLRFYGFKVNNLLDEQHPNFNILLDPKSDWALRHIEEFPKEINTASYYDLLKIPGIGPKSAKKIISSRHYFKIKLEDLPKMGITLKRAKYFILCDGKYFMKKEYFSTRFISNNLILENKTNQDPSGRQLSLFYE